MSRSVDQRAVIMEFDNEQFEKGIAQSKKSLAEFEEQLQLKGVSKAIDGINKQFRSIDFSAIQNSLSSIADRFSGFGIVGMTVIQNLTNAVVDFTKGALTNLYNKINEAGKKRALSLEKSRFLLQGILGDEKRVTDAMNEASGSVDGTAYSLDSAAKAASTFVATGLEGKELRNALDAVANLTATVSGNYDDISSIITKIVGSHKLYRNELNSIVSRGFALDEYIVEYIQHVNDGSQETTDLVKKNIKDMGLLGKQAIDVADLTSGANGKLKAISSELVMEVLNSKLKDMAKRANETFTGAIENIGAAWSRIGALFWEPLVAQNSELVKFINAIRVNINAIKAGLEPFAKAVTDIILKLAEGAKVIALFEKKDGIESASKSALKLTDLFQAMFKIVKPLFDLFYAWLEVQNRVFGGPLIDRVNKIIEAFSTWVDNGTGAFKVTSNLKYKLDLLAQTLSKALKPLQDFFSMVRYAFYTVFNLGDATGGVEGFIDKITQLFKRVDKAYDRWNYRNAIADSFIKIFQSIKTVGEVVFRIISAIGEALADVFIIEGANNTKSFFEWFADILEKLVGYIRVDDESFNTLKETFKNLFGAAKGIVEIFGSILTTIVNSLPYIMPFVNQILAAVAAILDWVNKNIDAEAVGKLLGDTIAFLYSVTQTLVEWVFIAIEAFKEWIQPFEDAIEQSGILESANELLATAFEKLKSAIEGVPEKIQAFCDAVGISAPTFDDFVTWLNDTKTSIDNLKVSLENFKIGEGFSGFIEFVKGLFSEKTNIESSPIGGAASIGVGQRMKLAATFVGDTKNAIDAAGGNSTFESVKDSILKFVIPLLNAIPKLALAIMGLAALKTSLGILEEIRKFKQPLADVREAWAGVGKSFSKFIDKSVVTAFIATIAFLILSIGALLVIINKITESDHPVATFVIFGVILAALAGFIVGVSLAMNKILKSLNAQKNNGLDKVPKVMASIALVLVATAAVMLAIGKAMILMATAMQIAGGPGQFAIIAAFLAAYLIILMLIISLLTEDAADKAKQGQGGSKRNPNLTASNADKQAQKYYGIAAIIGAVAVAMLAIGKAMVLMATAMKIDESVWWKALIFFGVFGGFVIGLMFLAKQTNGVDYKALLSIAAMVGAVAGVMLAFAASIDIIMVAIAKIAALVAMGADMGTTLFAFIGIASAMVAAIGALTLIMIAASKLGDGKVDYKSMLAIAVAMVAFSVAIDILMLSFTPLVALLSSPAASAAWAALGMLALMMGVMVVAVGGLTALAAWAPGGGTAMIIAAAAMISFATAMLILSLAFNNFVAASAEFLLLMDAYSNIKIDDIVNGITNLFTGLAEGFKNALPSIQNFIGQLFTGDIFGMIFDYLLQALETKISKIADSFGRIVDKIHEVLIEKADKIADIKDTIYDILFGNETSTGASGGKFMKGAFAGIDESTNKSKGLLGVLEELAKRLFVDTLPTLIVGFFKNLGDLIKANADNIKEFAIGAIHWFGDIFRELLLTLIDVINSMTDLIVEPLFYLLGSVISHIANWLVDHHEDILTVLGAPISWLPELMIRHREDILTALSAPIDWLGETIVRQHDTILSTLGGITEILFEWLGKLIVELSKWWNQHWKPDVEPFLYTSFMDTLSVAMKALQDSTVTITATAVALGLDIVAGIIGGLISGVPEIVKKAIELVETLATEVCTQDNINRMMDAGATIVKNYCEGISNWLTEGDGQNVKELRKAFDDLWQSIIDSVYTFFGIDKSGNPKKDGTVSGLIENILKGFANSLYQSWLTGSPLYQAVTWICDQVKGQANAEFEVNSPSKWAERLGGSVDEGLANGIKNNGKQIINSVDGVTDGTKEAFSTLMETLKIAGDEEFDINPTITPVVDTSNIEDAAAYASRAFGGVNGMPISYGRASYIAAGFAQNGGISGINGETSNNSVVNFTQNNYSPKSLSHYELYRQTKNLLHTIDSRT